MDEAQELLSSHGAWHRFLHDVPSTSGAAASQNGIEYTTGSVKGFGVEWTLLLLTSPTETEEPVAFVHGNVQDGAPVFIKSSCREAEVLDSTSCDCRERAEAAAEYIKAYGSGVIIHLRQEGRGHGMESKVAALDAERAGVSTAEVFEALGLPFDIRTYGDARAILQALNLRRMKLLDAPQSKFGVSLRDVAVEEVALDYKIHPDARNYHDVIVEQGRGFFKKTLDTLPTNAPRDLHQFRDERTQYVDSWEDLRDQQLDNLATVVKRRREELEEQQERTAALAARFVDSAPELRAAKITQQRHTSEAQRQRTAHFVSEWLASGAPPSAPDAVSPHVDLRKDGLGSEALSVRDSVAKIVSESKKAAKKVGRSVRYSLEEKLDDDQEHLEDAVGKVWTEESDRLIRTRDSHVAPSAREEMRFWSEHFTARTLRRGRSALQHLENSVAFNHAENRVRKLRRGLASAFVRSVWGREGSARELLDSQFTSEALPPRYSGAACADAPSVRGTLDEYAAFSDADERVHTQWSPIFHMKGRNFSPLTPVGRVPEPPELSARLDANVFEGQKFYREHPDAHKYAPPPVDHDFYRLGSKWTYWAQRSVVGDAPVRVFVYGEPDDDALVRVHRACTLGDACKSDHCECGQQLEDSFAAIEEHGSGVVIYLDQDGRGAGAIAKSKAYQDHEKGVNTFDSYTAQGLPEDPGTYDDALVVLQQLGLTTKRLRLLANNSKKLQFLRDRGIDVMREPLEEPATRTSASYLRAKAEHGHMMEHLDQVVDPVTARQGKRRKTPSLHGPQWWESQCPPVMPVRHTHSLVV